MVGLCRVFWVRDWVFWNWRKLWRLEGWGIGFGGLGDASGRVEGNEVGIESVGALVP